ncbi:hypothetical protein GY45DRAFT_141533 [Cubamyces sp. BRFM 1775]|nr:hypothetical protein GY45DRAFT_141533 [Cubamyces sp. BRFM 1775]
MVFISALRVRPALFSCQDRSVPILRKPPCVSPPPHSSQTSTDQASLHVVGRSVVQYLLAPDPISSTATPTHGTRPGRLASRLELRDTQAPSIIDVYCR